MSSPVGVVRRGVHHLAEPCALPDERQGDLRVLQFLDRFERLLCLRDRAVDEELVTVCVRSDRASQDAQIALCVDVQSWNVRKVGDLLG